MATINGAKEASVNPTLQLLDAIENREMSGIIVSYIMEKPVIIENAPGGQTVGGMIDTMIANAISSGERITSFTVKVTDNDWNMWRSF